MCRGVEWTLHKRYRDFYELHHELIKENQNYNIELPKLPEKRWFERQRWLNRYVLDVCYCTDTWILSQLSLSLLIICVNTIFRSDEKYGWIRRIQLQDYLRAVVKIRVLRNESLSFWKFVCMPKRVMIGPQTAEEAERENSRSRSRSASADVLKGATTSSGAIKAPIDNKGSGPRGILHKPPSTEVMIPEPSPKTENAPDVFDPDADLTSFNETLALAAKEAIMRGLYGSRNSKADVDNISSLKGERAEPAAADTVTSKAGSLKLNKVYDDNGEEVTTNLETAHCQDLSFIASSNARLNTRLTSKEEFASPHSKTAAPEMLHQVNKAWSNAEMAVALDALNTEEFDTNLHFSGPRSGPPSLSPSPNVSLTSSSGVDFNRNDLSILPGPPPPFQSGSGSTALSSSVRGSQFKVSASPGTSPVFESVYMTPKPPSEDHGVSGVPGAPEKKPRPILVNSNSNNSNTNGSNAATVK